jgi:hypothetical protein
MHVDITEDGFASTHWSLVARAHGDDTSAAHASLLTLCLRYWYPVYAYLRRSGHAPEHAHDLARGFFQALMRSVDARDAATRYGRFRLFLLAELHRFLSADQAPAEGTGALSGPTLAELEARHRADYDYELDITRQEAVRIVQDAEGAVARVRRLWRAGDPSLQLFLRLMVGAVKIAKTRVA